MVTCNNGRQVQLLIVLTLAMALLIPASLNAQDARGNITGRVADSSGAVVAGAEVRATNTATGVSAIAKTNEAGNYILAYLIPGRYDIEAEISGFKRFVRKGIEVRIADTVRVDIALEIGDQKETVQVTAETPLLETADSSMGQVVDQRRIQELPLFGGAPYDLVLMAPGVMNSTNLRQRYVGTPGAQASFSSDGSGSGKSEFTIDGVANSMDKGIVFVPPQYSVSEFKVQSISYDASIGHTSGALVNVSLKSGTNELHGEAHYYGRNRIFDTPTVFQNRTGSEIPPYQDHRYGLSAGGPVYIPKVYNGKNKTFFFYLWEANKIQYAYDYTNTVPTADMKRGDLSPLLALGSSYQVYDPATTTANSNGTYSRQPFAGNIIPTARLDTVAQNLLKYWPEPNSPLTTTKEFRNNHFVSYAGPFPVWTHLARVDHTFNPNHRMYVRIMREGFYSESNRRFLNDYDGMHYNQDKWGFALDDVYMFSPSFFMNLRYGLADRWSDQYRFTQGFDLSKLGFSQTFLNQIPDPKLSSIPYVNVSPFTTLAGNGLYADSSSFINTFTANFTKLQGQHSIRFGGEVRQTREFSTAPTWDNTPRLTFDSAYTNGPFNTSTAPKMGGQIASFLLGLPATSSYMSKSANYATQEIYYGLYVHDDVKLTPKLTMNIGVRWEYETPLTERFNRSITQFDFNAASPIEAAVKAAYAANPIPEMAPSDFRVKGGLLFAGVNGNSRSLWKNEKNNLMPRIGFAYQIQPTLVLRTGYGIFFDSIGINTNNVTQSGFGKSTPVQVSMDSGLTFVANTANPFPNGLMMPEGAKGGLSTNLGQGVSFFQPNRKNPYNQRWSFGVQKLFPGQFMVDASYVGSRGTRLLISRERNFLPREYMSTSGTRDNTTINYLAKSFPSPFYGTNPIYGKTVSRAGLLMPYPQFSGVYSYEENGYSWYHSAQLRMEKRFAKSYTLSLSYTFSRMMEATSYLNASDPEPYEMLSTMDRPHRLVLSGIWELPFGKGRRFGGNLPGYLNFFAGGWQLNGMVQRQSGPALAWGDVWTLFSGDSTKVGLDKSERSVDRWFNTDAGFNKKSTDQLARNIRVSPVYFSNLRADGQARWDFSLFKTFPIVDRVNVQFRAEAINAWNHPNLSTPVMSPTSSTFGTIASQDATRTWIFSLKLNY